MRYIPKVHLGDGLNCSGNISLVDSAISIDTYLHKIPLSNFLDKSDLQILSALLHLKCNRPIPLAFTDSIVNVNSTQPFNPAHNVKLFFCRDISILFNCFVLQPGYFFASSHCSIFRGLKTFPLCV